MRKPTVRQVVLPLIFLTILFVSPVFCAEPVMVIGLDLIPDVQVTKISISPGKFNEPTIWIVIQFKNISNRPMQFKTICNFPGIETSVAAIVPNAVGQIKPGGIGSATYQYPLNETPKKMDIKVTESIVD